MADLRHANIEAHTLTHSTHTHKHTCEMGCGSGKKNRMELMMNMRKAMMVMMSDTNISHSAVDKLIIHFSASRAPHLSPLTDEFPP